MRDNKHKSLRDRYSEDLSLVMPDRITGPRTVFVSNVEKNSESHEFYFNNSYNTINEFNHILFHHHAAIRKVELDYRSDGSMIVDLDIDDSEPVTARGYSPCLSRYQNSFENDLSIEDGRAIEGLKLYCISVRRKTVDHQDFYWGTQSVTIPEFNHILMTHKGATIEKLFPVYRTSTEVFAFVRFRDGLSAPPPVQMLPRRWKSFTRAGRLREKHDAEDQDQLDYGSRLPGGCEQFFCVSSMQRNPVTHQFYSLYDCLSMNEYKTVQALPNCTESMSCSSSTQDACFNYRVVRLD